MRAIAARGGIDEALIYRHFGSKESLYAEVVTAEVGAVVQRLLARTGDLAINTALTLYRALAAFAICAVFGVVIGMAMSRSAIANWFFDPIISVGFPMPKIAFLPVVILWLGVYDVSKISMVVFDAIFPVVADVKEQYLALWGVS